MVAEIEPLELLTLALAIAVASADEAVELCPAGRHPAARIYANPTTGKKGQCRDCRRERWAERVRRGEVRSRSPHKTVAEPRRHGEPLPPAELLYLRRLAACMGCGAVREPRPNAKTTPLTRIQHLKGCPVARNKETQP